MSGAGGAATDVEYVERKTLSDHLADRHGVWLTRTEFKRMTLDELRSLDPCEPIR